MMKTFIISMDTPEGRRRLASMQKRCRAAGLLNVDLVAGVDARTLQAERIEKLTTGFCNRFCTPAMVGCMLSHMACWQRIVDQKLPMAIVLEDDAVLAPRFLLRVRQSLVDDVPNDFHIVLLGCFLCSPFVQWLAGAPPGFEGTQKARPIRYFAGTHAMVVSQAGAQYLLQQTQGKVQYHADWQLASLPSLKIYALDEDLAFQEDMTTSQIATTQSFPGTVNTLLTALKDSKNIPAAYYANVPIARLGSFTRHIVVTPWTILFFFVGLSGLVPISWVAALAAVDIVLVPPRQWRDVGTQLGAFMLGYSWRVHMPGRLRRL